MAEWVPACKNLDRKPEVVAIARATGKSRREVAAILLWDLWSWADDETADGFIAAITPAALVELLGQDEPFWRAVEAVGWAAFTPDGLRLPNFDRWLGCSAKRRLAKNRRQARWRQEEVSEHLPNVDARAPTTGEEKRKEEKRKTIPPLPPSEGGRVTKKDFLDAWNSAWTHVPEFQPLEDLAPHRLRWLKKRLREPGWAANWRKALEKAARLPFFAGRNDLRWRATVDWFLREGSVEKVLEGTYDRLGGTDPPPEPPETRARREAQERAQAERDRQQAEERRRYLQTPEGQAEIEALRAQARKNGLLPRRSRNGPQGKRDA